MIYERKNQGTCSVLTRVDLADDHTIRKVEVMGGCNGNLKGISQLLARGEFYANLYNSQFERADEQAG